MHIIIVGCGRVGAELALALHQEHSVSVIDRDPHAFDRLGPLFEGRTVRGHGMDRSALERAGIAATDALAATTSSDNVNVIVARIAQDLYHVERVVARICNPRRAPVYEKLNLQTVSSSMWGAQRVEQLLVHPGMQSIASAGNGEVQIFELTVPADWIGRNIAELVPSEHARAVALARHGKGILPHAELVLEARDVLQVSSTAEGVRILRERVHENGNRPGKE